MTNEKTQLATRFLSTWVKKEDSPVFKALQDGHHTISAISEVVNLDRSVVSKSLADLCQVGAAKVTAAGPPKTFDVVKNNVQMLRIKSTFFAPLHVTTPKEALYLLRLAYNGQSGKILKGILCQPGLGLKDYCSSPAAGSKLVNALERSKLIQCRKAGRDLVLVPNKEKINILNALVAFLAEAS